MNYSIITRFIFFLIIAGLWYIGLWHIAGLTTFIYLFLYIGYEILFLGLLIDAQFMTGMVPLYTLTFIFMFILAEWLKPSLLAYTN